MKWRDRMGRYAAATTVSRFPVVLAQSVSRRWDVRGRKLRGPGAVQGRLPQPLSCGRTRSRVCRARLRRREPARPRRVFAVPRDRCRRAGHQALHRVVSRRPAKSFLTCDMRLLGRRAVHSCRPGAKPRRCLPPGRGRGLRGPPARALHCGRPLRRHLREGSRRGARAEAARPMAQASRPGSRRMPPAGSPASDRAGASRRIPGLPRVCARRRDD